MIVTPAALPELPELPARPRLYVIVEPELAVDTIKRSNSHRPPIDSVLVWPEAAQWLREELLI